MKFFLNNIYIYIYMCDCKKNSGSIKNPSNCKDISLPTKDYRSIPINVDNNNLIKEIVSSTQENFLDITILKNMFEFQQLNEDKILTINNYELQDIINYPIYFSDSKPPENLKKLICLLSKKTCYTYNVLLNLFITINEESTKKIIHYYKKLIETKDKKYIYKIIKTINDPKNYKNSKYIVEINCEIYSKFLNFINALNTREYTAQIKINFGEKFFKGTFYTIKIPDYVKNFSQIRKFVEILFESKEIFKQLNDKATIYNTSIPANLNGEPYVIDSYNNFRNNDFFNYVLDNNLDGKRSYDPNDSNSYFDQKLPRKMFPVD